MSKNVDSSERTAVLSGRAVFADHSRRQELLRLGKLVSVNPLDGSELIVIRKGQINTTVDELANYITQAADSVRPRETVPDPPSIIYAIPSDSSVSIIFIAGFNGKSAIINYEFSIDNGITYTPFDPAQLVAPIIISGLTNGVPYTIYLKAINLVGKSEKSNPITVTPYPPADAPTGLTATISDSTITISFTPPANTFGFPITNYQYSINNGTSYIALSPPQTTSPIAITGLENGRAYTIFIEAITVGPGAASDSITATPYPPPGAPTDLVALGDDTLITLSFIPGSNYGTPIINYQYTLNGGAFIDSGQSSSPITISSLINGTPYSIYLQAINIAGPGPSSVTVTATPYPHPDPPTALSTNVSDSAISIYFTDGNNFGFPITNYQYSINDSNYIPFDPAQTTPPVTITSLTNGTPYTIRLETITIGPGPASDPITAIPCRVPDPPTIISTLDGNSTITIDFTPGSNYGGVITDYLYSIDSSNYTPLGQTSNPLVISSLTNGTVYTITLEAINAAGRGAPSAQITGTPYTFPDAPTIVSDTLNPFSYGAYSVTIDFIPGFDNGRSITNYQYSIDAGSNYSTFDPVQITSPITISSLAAGASYDIYLKAINLAGAGPASDLVSIDAPAVPPEPPTGITATPSDSTLTLDFTPGSNGGTDIVNYQYSYSTDGGTTYSPYTEFSPAQTTPPLTLSGLTNGTVYTILLQAINAISPSDPSAPITATPYPQPDPPTDLTAQVNDSTISIYFTAGATYGYPITNYNYSIDYGSNYTAFNPAQIASPVTIAELANGTPYTINLQAVTIGPGPSSVSITATPYPPPDAPTNLSAVGNDSTITISFTPGSDRGSAITDYQYSTDNTNYTALGQSNSPLTISSLINGTPYTIYLEAINVAGPGPASEPITATPYPHPDPPADLTAIVNDSTITINFTDGNTYGFPITNYQYSINSSNYVELSPAQTAAPITFSNLTNGTPYTVNLQTITIGPGPSSVSITATPYPPPDAPTNLSALGDNSAIIIYFTAGFDYGSAITNYQYSIDSGSNYTAFSPAQAVSPVTISSLTNGDIYTVQLQAINVAGPGPASASITATPYPHPDAPTNLSATVNDSTISINFTDGNTYGFSITNYQYSIDGSNYSELTPAVTAPPITIANLTNGIPYTIYIEAITIGPGAASEPITATPYPPPDPPTNLSAVGSDSTITISFTPGSDKGSAITNYQYSIDSGSNYTAFSPANAISPISISSLANNIPYTVYLEAINIAGPGPASAPVTATPFRSPAAPTNLSATVSDSTITVNFTDGDTYGAAITNYQYSIDDSNYTEVDPAQTAPPIRISSLTNGTPYTIRIETITYGPGLPSDPITATPYKAPDAPTNLSAVGGNSTITISFTAGYDNGSAITNYQYSIDSGSNYTVFNPVQDVSPVTISSLTNGEPYTVQLQAINVAGAGPASDPVTATPYNAPDPPIGLLAVASDSTITVYFTDGETYGFSITNYQYSIDSSNYTEISPPQTEPPITISSLANGTAYTINIQTITVGPGPPSQPITETPYKTPDAPTNLTAVGTDSTITISFTPGFNGGRAITDYKYSIDATTYVTSGQLSSPISISSLTNGTPYTIYLQAVNLAGPSPPSAPVTASPDNYNGPYPPTNLSAVDGDSIITVSFTDGSDNGSPITDYKYSIDNGISYTSLGKSSSPVVISNLTNGTLYTIILQAINAIGLGEPSEPITGTPYTYPDPPTITSDTLNPYTNGKYSVNIEFTPGSNNGRSITDYEYSINGGTDYTALGQITSPITLSNLDPGTTYDIYLKAVNLAGTGTRSFPVLSVICPPVQPDPPTTLSAITSNSTITINFTPGYNGGTAITNYQYSTDDGSNYTAFNPAQPAPPVTIGNLVNFTEYTIYLQTINSVSASLASEAITATPYPFADAPTGLSATASDSTIIIEFTPGNTYGYSITNYQYSFDGSTYTEFSPAQTVSPITISGLTNGTRYTIYIQPITFAAGRVSDPITATPYGPPQPPTGLSAVAGDSLITINFTPGSDGGEAITNYQYSIDSSNYFPFIPAQTGSPVTLSNLLNFNSYTIYLQAINSITTSLASDYVTATPYAFADPPTGLSSMISDSTVFLDFIPGFDNGYPITNYQYSFDAANYTEFDPAQISNPIIITGLQNYTTYTIYIQPITLAPGTASAPITVTPYQVADAPTGLSATVADSIITIYFTDGNTYGATITNYQYSFDNSNYIPLSNITTTSPIILDGLINASTYTIYLQAITIAPGNASVPITAAPYPLPDAPTGLLSMVSDSTVFIEFIPGSIYPSSITNYQYSFDATTYSTFSPSQTSTPLIITGLSNGTEYTINLQAINPAGPGAASDPITASTPILPPNPPTGISATVNDSIITLNFTPGYYSGDPITDYLYSIDNGDTYTSLGQSSPPVTISNLTNGTSYTIYLEASNSISTSLRSAPITATPYPPPDPPTVLSANPGDSIVTIDFTPGSDNGSAITDYQYSIDSGNNYTVLGQSSSGLLISSLANGVTYDIYLKAINVAGPGLASDAVSAILPALAPNPPTGISATPSDSALTINFTPGSDNGSAITDFQYSIDGGATYTLSGQTTSPITLSGLTNGTSYTILLQAINLIGTGAASAPITTTPYPIPDAPIDLTATIGNSIITIGFTDGDTYGYPITNYQYSFDSSNYIPLANVTTAPPITIDGLTNASTYTIYLEAITIGPGAASAPITATPYSPPDPPTNLSATGSDSAITLRFTPGSSNGNVITSYLYSMDDGFTYIDSGQSSGPITFSNLINNTPYTFYLEASNSISTSLASAPITAIPYLLSDPPTRLLATVASSTIILNFTDGNTYGNSITNYEYSINRSNYIALSPPQTAPPITFSSLINGNPYTIKLKTVTIGPGLASASITTTPYSFPEAPSAVSAIGSNSVIIVNFTNQIGIINYQYSFNGTDYILLNPIQSRSPIIFSNLINGDPYSIYLKAINPLGVGPASDSVTATPYPWPDAPTDLYTAAVDNSTITIGFTDGYTYEYSITNYQYSFNSTIYNTVSSFTENPPSVTLDGITYGSTYTIYLKAVTIGPGVASDPITATPYIAPEPPTNLSAIGSNSAVIITFTAGFNGGSAITNYQYSIDSGTTYTLFDPVQISSPITIDNLINGTTYTIYLQAINAVATGLASDPLIATPYPLLAAPTDISTITVGDSYCVIDFTPPDNIYEFPITDYQYSTDNVNYTSLNVTTPTVTIGSLIYASTYNIRLRAFTLVPGAASPAISVTPYISPNPPTDLSTISISNGAVVVGFTPGSNNGRPITNYEYSIDESNYTVLSPAQASTPITINLINNASYTIYLKAINLAGPGEASEFVSATIPNFAPSPPILVSAIEGNSRITVNFTNGYNNPNDITGYLYSIDAGETYISTDIISTPLIINSLTNGVLYTIKMKTINSLGTSIASESISANPYTIPDPPTNVTYTLDYNGNGYDLNTYFTPGFDQGRPITNYRMNFSRYTTVETLDNRDTKTFFQNFTGALYRDFRVEISFDPPQIVSPIRFLGAIQSGYYYGITLQAITIAGLSAETIRDSNTEIYTPLIPIYPPTNLSAVGTDSTITISFIPGSNFGTPIINYQYSFNDSNYIEVSPAQTSSPIILSSLTNFSSYTIYLQAINITNSSESSAPVTATPYIALGAPTDLSSITVADSYCVIDFTPPENIYESPITNYQYSIDGVNYTGLNVTTSTVTIGSLINASTYNITLKAFTVGPGAASAPVTVTPYGVPFAPNDLSTISISESTVIIGFTPGFNNGRPITNYQYSTDNSTYYPISPPSTASTITIYLLNGVTYDISLQAINLAGPGAASYVSATLPTLAPYPPTGLYATVTATTITINFTPGYNNGSEITDYLYSIDGGDTYTSAATSSSPFTISDLTPGTYYTIKLKAVNSIGTGAESAAIIEYPYGVPAAPTIDSITPGDSMLTTYFTPGSANGSTITDYLYSTDGYSYTALGQTTSTFTISSLTNGTPYPVTIQASNAAGTGLASDPVTATPYGRPFAPTIDYITPSDSTLTTYFTAGYDNGSTITNYQYSIDGGSNYTITEQTTSPFTISSLTNGTAYPVTIQAINAAGAGTASAPITETPYGVPLAPTIDLITPGDTQLTVDFTPGSNNGNAITDYLYSTDGSTYSAMGQTTSPFTIISLTNGTAYSVTIQASNAAGAGAASSAITATPYGVPAAPTINSITPDDTELTIDFTAGSDNGSTITDYLYSTDGSTYITMGQTTSPFTISSLTNGTAYPVTIKASNAAGAGAASASLSETPYGPPLAPTIDSITSGDTELTINFTAGFDNGNAITDYLYSTDGSTYITMGQTTSPFTITGLENGTEYSVTIKASNAAGAGAASTGVTGTPYGVPAAPTINTVTPGDTELTIDFTGGSDNGNAITDYLYSTDGSTYITMGQTTSPFTITGLTNGNPYTITLKASNAAGSGAASTGVTETPYGVPAAPTINTVTSGDTELTIDFTPGSDNGNAITDYLYSTDGSTYITMVQTTSPFTITGLENGTEYSVTIKASNAAGAGAASTGVTATPYGPPLAPTIYSITPGDTELTIDFTAGSSNGNAITDYLYSTDGSTYTAMGQTTSPFTIISLTNDTEYSVTIKASNAAGAGAASEAVSGTPVAP